MSTVQAGTEDAEIDLKGLFVAIWRHRLLVLASSVALGAIAFAGASVVSPKYQSEARLLIENRSPDLAARSGSPSQPEPILDKAGVASQVALLQSVDLIKKVARDFKLYERAEFDPSANPSIMTRLMVMIGLMKNPLDMPPEERVIKEFTQKLQVYQVEKSRVIAIQFSSRDRQLAASIPNAIADVYLSLQAGAKLDTTQETAKWLEPEIANLREKVRDAEAKVAEYRANSDLFRIGQQGTFAEQQLNDISQELARVRGDRATAEAKAENVRAALNAGRGADTLGEVVGSQMIQRLKETQSSIEGQIADLSTQLLDGHPRIKGLKSQLAGIRQQIMSETRKILGSLENEASTAKLREKQLTDRLKGLKADTGNVEEKQVGLNALEREAAAQRQLLETYLARYRAALSEKDMNATPADGRIVSRAVTPGEAYFPKIGPITIVATLAGFVLSSVFIMLSELFSGRAVRHVRWDDGLEEQAGLHQPKAVATPEAQHKAQSKASVAATPDEASEPAPQAAETVAAPAARDENDFSVQAVANHIRDQDMRMIACISLAGDVGSIATVALTRVLAESGRRTVLVDLTGEAVPSILMLENMPLPGITDLLSRQASYGETLHADFHSDAHIIPQGTADPQAAIRGLERMSMILGALGDAYYHVIVDCGTANVEAVSRLARNGALDIVLSAAQAEMDLIEDTAEAFLEAGYDDVVLMLDDGADIVMQGDRAAA